MFRRRGRREPTPAPAPWVEPPTPSTAGELLHLYGLDHLTDTDVDRVAELLLAPPDLLDRERGVLELRFGLDRGGIPRTVQEVGQEVGVAGTRIREVEADALAKVRAHYAANSSDFT